MILVYVLALYSLFALYKGFSCFKTGFNTISFFKFLEKTSFVWGCMAVSFMFYLFAQGGDFESLPKSYEFPMTIFMLFSVFMVFFRPAFSSIADVSEFKNMVSKLPINRLMDLKEDLQDKLKPFKKVNEKSSYVEKVAKLTLEQKLRFLTEAIKTAS